MRPDAAVQEPKLSFYGDLLPAGSEGDPFEFLVQ